MKVLVTGDRGYIGAVLVASTKGVTAVAAVAVVPTVLLLVIKTGVASPQGAGVLPAAEQANAARRTTKTPEPKTATPNPARPAGN